MVKRIHDKDVMLSGQGSLFDTGLAEGSLDVSLGFRQALSRALRECGKDRYQVAAEMSRAMNRDISKDMLDKCCSSDLAHGLRVESLTAAIYVIGSSEFTRPLFDPLDSILINGDESKFLRLAHMEEEKRQLEERIKIVRAQCGLK